MLTSDKVLAKIDWNLVISINWYPPQLCERVSTSPAASTPTTINFENGGIYFPSTTNSSALELNSLFSNTMSNNLIIGYTNVNDDRDAMGADFPRVQIRDGSANIFLVLKNSPPVTSLPRAFLPLLITWKLYKGQHTFTIGTHNEFYHIYNLFIRQAFGSYDYLSLQDFYDDATPNDYAVSYSLVDDVVGDGSAAAADFNAMQLAVYGRDKYQTSEKLSVTAGIRFDLPVYMTDPFVDTYFNDTAAANIEAEGYDLGGAQAGQMPGASLLFSQGLDSTMM